MKIKNENKIQHFIHLKSMGKCFYCFSALLPRPFILWLLMMMVVLLLLFLVLYIFASHPLNRIDRHHSDEDREITYCKSIRFFVAKEIQFALVFNPIGMKITFKGILLMYGTLLQIVCQWRRSSSNEHTNYMQVEYLLACYAREDIKLLLKTTCDFPVGTLLSSCLAVVLLPQVRRWRKMLTSFIFMLLGRDC